MANTKHDENRVPAILAVSNADNETPVVLWGDPATHELLIQGSLSVTGSQSVALQQKVTSNDLIVTLDSEAVALTTSTAEIGNVKNSGTFAVQASIAAAQTLATLTTITNDVGIKDNGNTITVDGTVSVNSHAVTNAGTFVVQENGAVLTALQVIDNMISGSEAQVDVVAALPAGTNALGKLLPPNIDVTAHANYARKYYTSAGAATDGIIWSPAAGTRWHVVTMYLQVSAAATITLEDDKAGGDDPVWKAELAANSGVVLPFTEKYPMASGEDAADLIITTSAGNVYVTAVGYEI